MAGSRIEDLLELVYAKNAVSHMLSGKAIARAVRSHFLVDAALNALLINLPLPVSAGRNPPNEDLVQAEQMILTEMTHEQNKIQTLILNS